MQAIQDWLNSTPIVVLGILILLVMCGSAAAGYFLRKRHNRRNVDAQDGDDLGGYEGYVVSAVLGLLALLLGFTFSLSVDRFETRRALVLQEANAIGTSYLRAQILAEPDRSRLSGILVRYTENRVALGLARPDEVAPLLETNDRLLVDLWAGTVAAFDGVRATDFSTSLLETVNEVIDLDASRKAGRQVRVPTEVFVVLLVYVTVTAGILGYVLVSRGVIPSLVLFALLTMSLMLIIDIDRPTAGGVSEGQGPMIQLRDTLKQQPPSTFDRWRTVTESAVMAPAL